MSSRESLCLYLTWSVIYTQSHTHTVTDRYLSSLSGGALLTSKHPFSQHKALLSYSWYMICMHFAAHYLSGQLFKKKKCPVLYLTVLAIMHVKRSWMRQMQGKTFNSVSENKIKVLYICIFVLHMWPALETPSLWRDK